MTEMEKTLEDQLREHKVALNVGPGTFKCTIELRIIQRLLEAITSVGILVVRFY